MSLVRNEQIKLLANALDRASTACFTVGIATPLAGYLYNVAGFRTAVSALELLLGLMAWIGAAIGLHFAGKNALKDLLS
jgi:hypothetical protein